MLVDDIYFLHNSVRIRKKKMTTPQRRSAASSLEARIAQLDARLRLAKTVDESEAKTLHTDPGIHHHPQVATTGLHATRGSELFERSAALSNATPIRRTDTDAGALSATYLGGAVSNATYSSYVSSPLYTNPNHLGNGVRSPIPATHLPAASAPEATPLVKEIPLSAAQTPYQHSRVDGADQTHSVPPVHTSAYEAYSSPWRESAFRANVEASAHLQQLAAETRGKRLEAMVSEAHTVGTEVEERDAQLLWYAARKDGAAAEMHKYLRESNDKVEELERSEIRITTETSAIKLEIEKVHAQLKEVREGMSRASERAHGIHAERVHLAAALKGSSEGSIARDQSEAQWHEHHQNVVMAQLRATIESLSEDVKAVEERHSSREHAVQSSRIASVNEAKALEADIEGGTSILSDLLERSDSLSRELTAFKIASTTAAKARAEKAAEAERKRRTLLEVEMTRVSEENSSILRTVIQQADTVTAQLSEEVADLEQKLRKTRKVAEEGEKLNTTLVEKLASLQSAIQGKQQMDEPQCHQKEKEVKMLLAARDENRSAIDNLQRVILQSQDAIRQLEMQTSRLDELLDEESKFKTILASLSAEMAASADLRNEEIKQHDKTATALETAHKESLEKVAAADAEYHRIKASNAATLDNLTRKLHEAREGLSIKERKLDELLTRNTQLQNTIIAYEEEKRKMERDAMVRKEAASRAAKAALLDLQ